MTTTAKERLLKGAKVLGDFWQAGERCTEEWSSFGASLDPSYGLGCVCEAKSKFCKAKAQWVSMAKDDGRGAAEGPFDVALMMTAEEWDRTGLTLKVEIPDVGVVGVGGPKGVIPMKQMKIVSLAPATMASILKIFKVFPGSNVEESSFAGVPVKTEEQFASNGQEHVEGPVA
jgi:hypothetical protein